MNRESLKPASALAVVLLVTLALAITSRAIRRLETKPDAKPVSVPQPSTTAESERAVAKLHSPSALATLIDQTIDESEFQTARWGVFVISARDGRIVYARNGDKLFTPASNMKVYTTAVALDVLGTNYSWRTSVYADSQPAANGQVSGNLTLYGRGAPDLTSRSKKGEAASLTRLADDLYARGLRHVQGNMIGDESYFRADPLGDGWQWNDVQWYFGAEPSALTIDDNEVEVGIEPAAKANEPPVVKLNTAQDYIHLTSDIASVKRGEQIRIGIHRGLSDNELRVWGEFPEGGRGFGARLSVHNPALWAARLFVAALKARGITVDGEARARDFRVPETERFDPTHAVELASLISQPLGEIVKATNKESINLNAELILRTLGRERGDTAADPDPHRTYERSDDAAGVTVIRQWLNRAGISTAGLALHDGSGLSRLDLVTPESMVRLLSAILQRPSGRVFQESLPIAGVDGTLKGRLRQYKDKLFAKTGSLSYDNTLSGFVTTEDGEPLVFSIMCNDQTGRAGATNAIDKIVSILANSRR